MFDVLVYVYEQYWRPEACPVATVLTRKLAAVGFEDEEVSDALTWLVGLQALIAQEVWAPSEGAMRVLSDLEMARLSREAEGYLRMLESSGVLTAKARELALSSLAAAPLEAIALPDFKVVLLLVHWALGDEPDALIYDEPSDVIGLNAVH